ncbi:3-(3-hydroxy-phenyl)propionate hydroxylase [Nocardia amikacinitolerans]|uniref:FAD-dependent monooxygenase n=1 Tax=Nocardia amikacinitolerans TaxID=756689 RepID=UPI0027E232AD|nr:FAD-dependent monooxygenase [Nocardia amikacinitolerans]MCP2295213.1 3-(3-hydroxy-phenyl)propionate hydroxylase [Nocardia amikacinitolerans]
MDTTDVVIAGAGPTGLMLACELRILGLEVALLDALPARTGESRAGGIHARTMEILDQRGMLDGVLTQGRPLQAGHFAGIPLDFSDFATRYPFTLVLPQSLIERELERRAAELGATVAWDSPVLGFRRDDSGVEVEIGGAQGVRRLRAAYLVGCDGGRSAVRKLAGIEFAGTDATMTGMLADVELAEPPAEPFFGRRRGAGDYSVVELQPGWYRLIVQRHDRVLERGAKLSFADFRANFLEITGEDFGMHSPRWVSHYGDAARQAARYRAGRVFLAGDAAHIHYPAGGQGLNLGVQDAVNLGWKLAAVLRADAPDSLLDTYQAERHPVAARVLHNTRAQTALSRSGPHTDALRDIVGELIASDEVRHRLGLMITALDIRYATGCDHPLAGRRVPDVDLTTAAGPTRVHELLRPARPVLLRLAETQPLDTEWNRSVEVVSARSHVAHWTIPGLGDIPTPATVLIRPDGYTAWATDDPSADGLGEVLRNWTDFAAHTR